MTFCLVRMYKCPVCVCVCKRDIRSVEAGVRINTSTQVYMPQGLGKQMHESVLGFSDNTR